MKRMVVWSAAAGCAVLSIAVMAHAAKKQEKNAPKPQPAAEAAAPAKPAEKIAYTFSDQSKVDAFSKLWQQRQATVIRMSVLKGYFQEEQGSLEKLNQQFAKDYNLDVTKNYRFDNERKVILEVESPQAIP